MFKGEILKVHEPSLVTVIFDLNKIIKRSINRTRKKAIKKINFVKISIFGKINFLNVNHRDGMVNTAKIQTNILTIL